TNSGLPLLMRVPVYAGIVGEVEQPGDPAAELFGPGPLAAEESGRRAVASRRRLDVDVAGRRSTQPFRNLGGSLGVIGGLIPPPCHDGQAVVQGFEVVDADRDGYGVDSG